MLLLLLALLSAPAAAYQHLVSQDPLVCVAGYGQRGRKRSAGVQWVRTCKHAHYCWEATSASAADMRSLFDFPWDDYYDEYYVQGCSGDYGTNRLWSPFTHTASGERLQQTPAEVPVNITLPHTITGRGGTIQMNMQYGCSKNFCSAAPPSRAPAPWRSLVLATLCLVAGALLS